MINVGKYASPMDPIGFVVLRLLFTGLPSGLFLSFPQMLTAKVAQQPSTCWQMFVISCQKKSMNDDMPRVIKSSSQLHRSYFTTDIGKFEKNIKQGIHKRQINANKFEKISKQVSSVRCDFHPI